MQYKTILNSIDSLKKLSNEKMKINNAVKLARLLKTISNELDIFNEQKLKLLYEYGILAEDGENFTFPEGNYTKFEKEFGELLEIETEKQINKITIEINSDFVISSSDLIALEDFIEFKEQEGNKE